MGHVEGCQGHSADCMRIMNKIESFRNAVAPRQTLHLTLLTTYGVAHNEYWNMVQNEVTMDDLFG